MSARTLGCAAAVLCTAVAALSATAQVSHPAPGGLPPLVFDDLTPKIRAGLQRAYKAAQASPRDPAAAGRLGMLLQAYEQYRSADICYRTARALAPDALSWTYLSGTVEAELGEHAAAAAAFRRALEIDRGYWPARLRLADALMQAGELDASRVEYEALVRDLPELALAHYGFARLLASRGEGKPAVAQYERTVELEPGFGPAHYALGLAYRDAGSGERATAHLEAYRRLGARRPVPPDRLLEEVAAMKGTARDLLAEGVRLGEAGRAADAIAMHLEAVSADPSDAQAHVNLIALYGRAGQPAKAAAHYRAALGLGTSLAEAHYNYGVLLAAEKRDAEAAALFRKALEVDPFYPAAHNNLAALLAREGHLDQAAEHYRLALANEPQHRAARAGLGRVLIALGRPLDAVEQFRKLLIRGDGDAARDLFEIARAYQAAGHRAEAVDYGQQALDQARSGGQGDFAGTVALWLRHIGSAK